MYDSTEIPYITDIPNSRIKSVGLAILLVGEFMTTLDVSIVNVALPSIATQLPASGAMLVLVSAGYTLTYATLLILGARLGDHYGHRRVFGIGIATFTLASLACGVAPTGALLVAARVVQGVGGALIAPQVLSIIQLRSTGRARSHALGWYAAAISLGGVVGQLLGGALTGISDDSWRAVFLINVPVGVVLLIASLLAVPATEVGQSRGLDPRGAALLSGTVLAVTIPLVLGPELGWPLWLLIMAGTGALLALGSIVHLRRTPPDAAIIDIGLLRHRGVAVGAGSLFATMAAYGALLFSTMLLLQGADGMGPLRSGLAVTPYIVGFAATSLLAGRVAWGSHPRTIVIGLSSTAVAYLGVGFAGPGGLLGGVALAAAGAGIGLGFGPVLTQVTQRVPTSRAADTSGTLTTVAQLGYLSGVAVLGTWFVTTAGLPDPGPASRAFTTVAMAMSALAVVSAVLAGRLAASSSAPVPGSSTPASQSDPCRTAGSDPSSTSSPATSGTT